MSKKTPEERASGRYPWQTNETIGNIKVGHKRKGYADCIREKVEPLEEELEQKTAENLRLRALVQELRGKLDKAVKHGGAAVLLLNDDKAARQWMKVLKELRKGLSKQEGFVPTNTTEG